MKPRRPKSELKRLQYLKNLRHVREFLGLTLSELAALMPSSWKNREHVSKSEVCGWQNGSRTMSRAQLDRVAQLIANKLTARYHREIGVRILVNSPWHITAHYWCDKCKAFHELRRADQKCRRGTNKRRRNG